MDIKLQQLQMFGEAVGALFVFLILFYILIRFCRIFVYISSNEYGVVEKIWSRRGSIKTGFISLNGCAGYQPELLRTGPHFFLPFLYKVHRMKLITVRTMAYVYARDGKPLPAGQTLARTPPDVAFEDVRGFLAAGGERGPQRAILREGIYAINTAQFVVITDDKVHAVDVGEDSEALKTIAYLIKERQGFSPVVIKDTEDAIGIVTVHDGPALDHDNIIAPTVGDVNNPITFHNSFQDIEAFLAAGGRRGRQEQVIVEGTYFINRLFATVEVKPKKIINVGMAGVVVSYTGAPGVDVSGETYKHGELVQAGQRGVWQKALRPGKYPINPYAINVINVPTTNFVLRWIENRVEDHGYDSGLSEIPLITRDAFQPMLPLSIVVHIAPDNAPRVIQRFADIQLLVDQTIDPMVSAFFKDVAQSRTLLELISSRAELQKEALMRMRERFAEYDLDLQEVMIGTPRADNQDMQISMVLDQLRVRQVAIEQKITYVDQQQAAETEKELNEAKSRAAAQLDLTRSEIDVAIALNKGMANLRIREQEAEAIKITADANAHQTMVVGDAEARKVRAIGLANAEATQAQVSAYAGDGAEFQLRRDIAERFATAIENAQVPIVPGVSIQNTDGKTNLVDGLLAMMYSKTL